MVGWTFGVATEFSSNFHQHTLSVAQPCFYYKNEIGSKNWLQLWTECLVLPIVYCSLCSSTSLFQTLGRHRGTHPSQLSRQMSRSYSPSTVPATPDPSSPLEDEVRHVKTGRGMLGVPWVQIGWVLLRLVEICWDILQCVKHFKSNWVSLKQLRLVGCVMMCSYMFKTVSTDWNMLGQVMMYAHMLRRAICLILSLGKHEHWRHSNLEEYNYYTILSLRHNEFKCRISSMIVV